MIEELDHGSEWTGLRGQIMGWYLSSPLRRLAEMLVIGDSRSRVLAEARAALGEQGTVLDVGAGSGYFSLALAQELERVKVISLDLSQEMLNRLRAGARARRLVDRIDVLEGSVYNIRLADGSVDMVTSNGVLHELDRPEAALWEMVRVVRPGGLVVVTDFRADTWIGRRVASAHHRDAHGPFQSGELKNLLLGVRLENVKISELRHLLVASGSRAAAT